jgi:hypothetical protein
VGLDRKRRFLILPMSKLNEIEQVDGVDAVSPSYGFLANPGQVTAVSFGVSSPTTWSWRVGPTG